MHLAGFEPGSEDYKSGFLSITPWITCICNVVNIVLLYNFFSHFGIYLHLYLKIIVRHCRKEVVLVYMVVYICIFLFCFIAQKY